MIAKSPFLDVLPPTGKRGFGHKYTRWVVVIGIRKLMNTNVAPKSVQLDDFQDPKQK